MTIPARPGTPAAVKKMLGLSLILICVGTAAPKLGVRRRQLATLDARLEGVDGQLYRAARARRAGQVSEELAISEPVRLTAVRDSVMTGLETLAEELAHEEPDAYARFAAGVVGLWLFGLGYRQSYLDPSRQRSADPGKRFVLRVVDGEPREPTARRSDGARFVDVQPQRRLVRLAALGPSSERHPHALDEAMVRIRHLTGEHAVIPHDVQLRAAHAIADSDSPEAALRALRVSGVLYVLDSVGANTGRLTGAIPEIWHRFHPD